MTPLRLLFVKESQNWPRACGHDVHGAGMMVALAARGHAVELATLRRPTAEALAGIRLSGLHDLNGPPCRFPGWTPLQRKLAGYFGVKDEWAAALAALVRQRDYDAVVVVASHLLPLLAAVRGPVRVWYPADDQAWQHLSRVRARDPRTWGGVRLAAINAVYERAFAGCLDRVWVVSPPDRTAVRLVTGRRQVDLIPNGVDADHYHPGGEPDRPCSCVFWGRLDFGPNVDALAWFLGRVWPAVRAATLAATLSVFGFNPTARVREL
ncbi:MAG: glycosyltransferase, partial [Gemmataceae bacterium]|nr:glycosyltransferase [Gemmataceae bacterium]